jgi:cytochrome P450
LFITYGFYNAFVHPLRQYPGPLLWRCYRFPYVIAIQRGILHKRLKDFHVKYGPIVRIAPDELSYADGRAWKDIYANRPGHLPFERNPIWFQKMKPDEPNSIMGPNEADHARYRRAFANSFSERHLKEQAPVVESYVDFFIAKLKEPINGRQWQEKIVNLKEWFHYLLFDISGDLTYGESFNCLKNGKAHWWVEVAEEFGKGLAMIASVNHYKPLNKYLRYIIPKRILKRSMDHRVMSSEKAQQRVAMDLERPDWVTPAKQFDDHKGTSGGPLTGPEWGINLLIVAFAASETTASTLTGIIRELVQHRGVLHRLTREIREAFENESDITIASTKNLPYLEAVINEGFRLDPTVAIGIPRVVPKGGEMVCERYVPGGVSSS